MSPPLADGFLILGPAGKSSVVSENITKKVQQRVQLKSLYPGSSFCCSTQDHCFFSHFQVKLEFLPGESHGQRSLEDYSPWGRK